MPRSQSSVQLVPGKKAQYWHLYKGRGKDKVRVGRVSIGKSQSIQVFLNQKSRGQGIGRVAYKKAVTQSGHSKVYAHMRKSNIASRKAASHAGFKVQGGKSRQLTMVWKKR